MSTTRLVLLMFVLNIAVVGGGLFVNYKMIQGATLGASQPAAEEKAEEQAEEEEEEPVEYVFVPVEKVIVSLPGDGREHYFVLDLVLQAEFGTDPKKLAQVDPMVRSSVVANLSAMRFEELRALQIPQLQEKLEQVLLADFASRKVATPFQHVLVSKMIVQ